MKVFITGTPYSGKTTFFEQLASGQGSVRHYLNGSDLNVHYFSRPWKQTVFEFFDLPGFDGLAENSEAAQLAKQALAQEKPDRIVFVISTQNFGRQLTSLLRILEWGIPVLLVAHENEDLPQSVAVDWKLMAENFQTPVHPSQLSNSKLRNKFYENLLHASKPRLSQWQKTHPAKLLDQLVSAQTAAALPGSKTFSENFYRHWSFFPVSLAALTVFAVGLNKLVLGFYGLWMERTLLGRYLHSFFEMGFKALGLSDFLKDLVIGNYGLLTLGLAYALAFVYPVLLATYLFLNILIESRYWDHLKVWFLGLMKNLHLPESYFHIALTGLGCNLVAIQRIKNLQGSRQKFLGLMFLMLGVPCAAQSLILGNVLLGINPLFLILFLGLMLIQAGILGTLLARINHVPHVSFLIQPQNLRQPDLGLVWKKSWQQLRHAVPATLPLLFLSALVLAMMDGLGLLQGLRNLLGPFLGFAFGLPPETTDVFLIGFFRRDFGAVGFYNLTNQGSLNAVQTLICLCLISFFYPCFASMVSIARNFSRGIALQVFGFLSVYNLLLASALNWILNL